MTKFTAFFLAAAGSVSCITSSKNQKIVPDVRQKQTQSPPAKKNSHINNESKQFKLISEPRKLNWIDIAVPEFKVSEVGSTRENIYSLDSALLENSDFCFQKTCDEKSSSCFKQYLHPGQNIILKINSPGLKKTEVRCCVRKENSYNNTEICGKSQFIQWKADPTNYSSKLAKLHIKKARARDEILLTSFELNQHFRLFIQQFKGIKKGVTESSKELENIFVLSQNHLRIGPDRLSVALVSTKPDDIQKVIHNSKVNNPDVSLQLGTYMNRYDSDQPRNDGAFINNGQTILLISSAEILAVSSIFGLEWYASKQEAPFESFLQNRFQQMSFDIDVKKLGTEAAERNKRTLQDIFNQKDKWGNIRANLAVAGAILGIAGMAIAMLEQDYSLAQNDSKQIGADLLSQIKPLELKIFEARDRYLSAVKEIGSIAPKSAPHAKRSIR